MERAIIWLKCAAMNDPVRPVIKKQAVIGWEAKDRKVDLVIDSSLKGSELLLRMKGWVTGDVVLATGLFEKHGRLKILDNTDLVIETPDMEHLELLEKALTDTFQGEIWIELIKRNKLI